MDKALARTDQNDVGAAIMERVIIEGDLSKLEPAERVRYYASVCESVGLNPLTRPFDYLTLNGKLTLYAKKDATDQLRKINGISLAEPRVEQVGDMYVVTVKARDANGRTDTDIGVVNVAGLKGDALANAMMKALTKAKRRVTLSMAGLGWLDETEVETIPGARPEPSYSDELTTLQPTPEPPRQIADATLDAEGRVVTGDGEIVGQLEPNRPSPELLAAEFQRRLKGAHTADDLRDVSGWCERMQIKNDPDVKAAFEERRRELKAAAKSADVEQPELIEV